MAGKYACNDIQNGKYPIYMNSRIVMREIMFVLSVILMSRQSCLPPPFARLSLRHLESGRQPEREIFRLLLQPPQRSLRISIVNINHRVPIMAHKYISVLSLFMAFPFN